jgi:ABC-2 type transport system ATP-binding protein
MQPLISLKGLRKEYPGTVALDGLSLELAPGEIVGLLGPNGAGKTTAIHVVLGLLTPSAGDVSVFGLSPITHRHEISRSLNFSSAYVHLPTNLKVQEALSIFAKLYSVRSAKKKLDGLLELFEIAHLKGRLIGALSSGEKTRVNLAKCLLNDPKLLLLDEPTASLDPEMADTVRKALKKIQKDTGTGILYTSHNMAEVEEICDRIYFIHEGRLIASGTPPEVMKSFQSSDLEEVFIKIVRSGDFVLGR